MTRERSTWNIHQIAKQAGLKLADPYTMNQDHVNQQPAADEYVIGDPSTFAEDIHPSTTTWEAEYSGGQVKRNEIGMPEMRNDTFNHPEKTASEEVLTKKAALCVAIARSMLSKTASNLDIEEQSISLMHLPDVEVMSTYTRLAAKQDQDQQQQVQAAKQDQDQQQQVQAAKQDQDQQQQQVQAAQQQDQQGQQQQEQKQAAKQDQDQQQQVQAAVINDPRSTAVRALVGQQQQDQQGQQQEQQKQAGQDQQQQDQQQQEQKQAGQEQQAQMQQQLAQMIQQAQQQLEQLQAQAQQQQAGQQQEQQAQMQQQSQAQQVAQAVQQAIQQGQDPVAAADACMAQYQQQQGQSQQQGNDGELIDQMLAQQTQQQQPMANMDIQLDTPTMDVGEVQLGPEDDMLMQLFANEETQQAQQAQEGGQQQQKQAHTVRTASMRTVGTVPSQGVSRIGGGSTATAGAGNSNLSSLWSSAPDVREAFGIPTNQ
jgi:hypothetical protein